MASRVLTSTSNYNSLWTCQISIVHTKDFLNKLKNRFRLGKKWLRITQKESPLNDTFWLCKCAPGQAVMTEHSETREAAK